MTGILEPFPGLVNSHYFADRLHLAIQSVYDLTSKDPAFPAAVTLPRVQGPAVLYRKDDADRYIADRARRNGTNANRRPPHHHRTEADTFPVSDIVDYDYIAQQLGVTRISVRRYAYAREETGFPLPANDPRDYKPLWDKATADAWVDQRKRGRKQRNTATA